MWGVLCAYAKIEFVWWAVVAVFLGRHQPAELWFSIIDAGHVIFVSIPAEGRARCSWPVYSHAQTVCVPQHPGANLVGYYGVAHVEAVVVGEVHFDKAVLRHGHHWWFRGNSGWIVNGSYLKGLGVALIWCEFDGFLCCLIPHGSASGSLSECGFQAFFAGSIGIGATSDVGDTGEFGARGVVNHETDGVNHQVSALFLELFGHVADGRRCAGVDAVGDQDDGAFAVLG